MAGVKPLLETIGALLPKGIKAWHASPHDFDKVDLSKIGTGQGAQSYGPGFYAAESPAVSGRGGEYWQEFSRHPKFQEDVAQRGAIGFLEGEGFDRAKAIEASAKNLESNERWLASHPVSTEEQEYLAKLTAERRAAHDLLVSDKQVGPRVYELNLKADPRSFLQWDEPLSQQNPAVRGVVDKFELGRDTGRTSIVHDESTGENIYRILGQRLGNDGDRLAMKQLSREGIPGVRYLDQQSRAFGNLDLVRKNIADTEALIAEFRASGNNLRAAELDQTRARLQRGLDTPRTYNYVVNNPDIIEIMRKLAIPGMVGGGAYTAYQPGQQQ